MGLSALILQTLGRARPRPAAAEAHRWVVLDVETTGLDASSASLLAVAAVGVRIDWQGACALDPRDSFERFLKPQFARSDDSNVLLHGIGRGQQAGAENPQLVLEDFAKYIADAPLLAFHAGFDRALLQRASAACGVQALAGPWLDLADICRVLWPQEVARYALDEWLDYLDLECAHRHRAASDAWVEAEVLQKAWPKLVAQCSSFKDVQKLSRQARWLQG